MSMNRLVRTRFATVSALLALSGFALTACGSDPAPAGSAEPSGSTGSTNASGLACPDGKLSAE
jgi:phosphate transport system substrate-binding protein